MKKHVPLIVLWTQLALIGYGQEVLTPNTLTAEFNSEKRIISLSWEASSSEVAGYNLFLKQSNSNSFFLWGKAGLISGTNYEFEVISRDGTILKFKVCAVQNFP